MPQCKARTVKNQKCKKKISTGLFCWMHDTPTPQIVTQNVLPQTTKVCITKRKVVLNKEGKVVSQEVGERICTDVIMAQLTQTHKS